MRTMTTAYMPQVDDLQYDHLSLGHVLQLIATLSIAVMGVIFSAIW
jgi:hypothetical protein